VSALALASLVVGAVGLGATAYLGALALLAWRRAPLSSSTGEGRYAFVVPSHNESASIAGTVESLLAVDFPKERFDVVVVADNCSDDTADKARAAGARVIERFHDELKGKGYALDHAFELLLEEDYLAFAIVDADTEVSENLLAAFARRVELGELACQAEYAVSNVEASWRTRLMAVALSMFHGTRSLARERLGLSCGLRGNGMCFTRELLEAHPHRAYSLVEDVEYGIAIGLAGVRVAYAWEAEVRGEMVSSGKAAASQRRRWEGGRAQLIRQYAGRLLAKGLGGSLTALDLAMDLLVPPLSYVGLWCVLGLGLEGARLWLEGGAGPSTWVNAASAAGLGAYVIRGALLSGLGIRAFLALAWAPIYVIWKIALVRPWKADKEWVRTQREAEQGDEDP
jgi:GT2 family glycosyltransferase